MKHKKLSARILSLVLTVAMVCTMLPSTVFATEGNATLGTSNIECHVEHDEDCGYKEAVEGADCSHKNEDGTYSCASVSDNTATPGDADKSACTHEDDCGYVEAVEGADCTHSCEICKPLDSGSADKQPAQEQCSCDVLCTEDKINADCTVCGANNADLTNCKGEDGKNAAVKRTYEQVVELFTALPAASVINRTTTQEEKDAVIAQLTAAMDAFDALTADEQALFMKEQAALYKAAMALNDAITGVPPALMVDAQIPPFVEGVNKRYKAGETFRADALKVGDRIAVGAICTQMSAQLNFDSYELFITNGQDLTAGPYFLLGSSANEIIKDRYENNNNKYTGGATHVSTRTEWVKYAEDNSPSSPFFTAADKSILAEYDVTVGKTGLTGAAAKFEIVLAEGNKLVEGDSFKVADYDTLLVTLTPNGGGSFKAAPTVTVDSGATAGTVTKDADSEVYTCEVTGFTANATITVAGTAEAGGGTTVNTWAELQTALTAGGDIKLTADITAGSSDVFLNVPANITDTLDLNGFTIDRGLKDATAILNGHVITINGDLTVKDTSTEGIGVITGAKNSGIGSSSGSSNIAGGIYVPLGGVFTLESGKISGNIASGNGGGVYNSGTFTMKGGEISANTSMRFSGGVSNSGTFTMEGGEISANTASSGGGGGGVMATSGTFIVGGTAVIDNNKSGNTGVENADNLLLYNSLIQQSTATPLATGASIGVTIMDSGKGAFTDENATWETHADKFFSDNTAYKVRYDVGTKKLELVEGPSITVATQNGTATYGTAANPTFAVTTANFGGGGYPDFAPNIAWTTGTAPAGVTAAFSGTNNETLTMNTTAATPAGEYTFMVVSAKDPSTDGNYESAVATLTVGKREATITWGATTGFTYNGSVQAPTATVTNAVNGDVLTVTVTGGQTNVGTGITATADALTGTAAGNYAMPSSKPTQTFAITAKTVTVSDGTLEVKKPYDGKTDAGTPTGALALTGVVSADTANVSVKVDTVGTYADANVGKNKTVTLTISLEGSAKGNYTLDSVTTYEFKKAEITKVAYTGIPASAPDSTPASKGDKSITIKPVTPPTDENVEYAVSKTNTPPTSDSDWQTSTTFNNLDPNTEYYFFARVKENDNHAPGGVSSPGTSITTDKSEYTTKPTKPDGTPDSKSDTSITLKTVTPPDGETLEYGIKKPDGTIDWQDGPTFSPLSPNTEYKFYTRVKENDKHKAGPESDVTTIKTDLSDAEKIAAAKKAVTDALDKFTPTNATDADTIMALVNKAITDAGITGVTPSWDAGGTFNKNNADEDKAGSVTGTIKLTCGSESDTVALNKTIAQLPSDPAEKVRLVKAAIEAALNAYTATNATTDADIKAIVDKANTDSGVKTVTVAWGTPGFSNTNSTNSADGKVTGKFDLSCTSGGSTANGTVLFDRPIERSDEQKLADAKTKAEAALAAMTATNNTTADDVMTVVNNALSGTGVTAAWKTPSNFNKTLATESAAGNITGTIEFSLNSKKSETNANLPIARLVADKTALTNALADANNAKIGIYVENGAPSSVQSGRKFVSDAEMKALTDAIAAAQAVANNTNATTAEVTAAANALNDAVTAFKAAIKTGTYTSSGGGGGSSSGGGSTTTPPTVVPPTTTQPNPPTTVETKVPATVDNKGNANVNVTDKTMQDAINKAVAEAKKNGTSGNGISVVISVTTGGKDANTVTVNLPKTVQDQVIAGKVLNTVVVVDRPDISINMNLATITEINKQAKSDVQLSATRMDNTKLSGDAKTAIGNRPTFDLKATYASGSKAISNFGNGNVTVGIPYTLQAGEVASGLYAVYVDGNGKVTYLTNSSYDAEAKMLRFSTNHFSVYGIGYKAPTNFSDITNHWAKSDIEFVVNRGLFSGTSNTTFSPDGAMTRGMFVTALGRLAGIDVNAYKTNKFTDVKTDAYYAPYANWAASKGITNGTTATTFAPDSAISRQEMAVMMNNYAKALGYSVPQTRAANTFADNANIASWAADAVKQMQMAGILNGKNSNKFDPTGTATRGEISAMLRRYVELVIDRTTTEGWTTNDSGSGMYYQNGKALTGSRLLGGTTYVFNNYGETTSKTNTAGATTTPALATDGKKYITHKIVKGDTLWNLAQKHGTTVNAIVAINNIADRNRVPIGTEIKIPQK